MNKSTAILLLVLVSIFCRLKAQDNTLVIMQTGMPVTEQSYFYSGHGNGLQTDNIKEYWDEGKYITSAAYTTKGWFVTMAKNCGYTNQSYNYISSWPSDWIKERIQSGYCITSLAVNNDKWFIVMSEGTDITSQAWNTGTWSELEPWISSHWDDDYYITQAVSVGEKWTIVMSKTKIYSAQTYFRRSSSDSFFNTMHDKWNDGYSMIIAEYGNGSYLGVASKFTDSSSPQQHIWVNLDDVGSPVKEYWNKGYQIAYIGGGFSVPKPTPSIENNSTGGYGGGFNGNIQGVNPTYGGSYGGNPTPSKTWKNCHSCGGTGRCKHCNGTGKYSYSKNGKCGVCHGTGTCAGCRGSRGYYY